ncbi:MAG: tryptophan--tRNA ligase [Candidatus Daviesbacteria bacterium]|nr:tryptophan--tRNA ligase [Candidatus Daviesbacteria bacterium]
MKKWVFSGIQPSGNLHIGNYLGALKNWVASQQDANNVFCIVDLHAITVPQDPKILKQKIREVAGVYFAAGIDPKQSIVFVQSDVSAHAELAWILNCFTPVGWMGRMTQFKDKSGDQRESVSVGLFDYPVLMASDILLYDTDEVPVGEDQKQHVEITRDIAQRFNSIYGETFKLPKPVIPKSGARIMDLIEPTKKMSKSDLRFGHSLPLLIPSDEIRSRIMAATTDSQKEIRFDLNRPGVYNLLEIYEGVTGASRKEIESIFEGKGYGDFKKDLVEKVVGFLEPFKKRYQELMGDPSRIESLLAEGGDRARVIANQKLTEVKSKVGLG